MYKAMDEKYLVDLFTADKDQYINIIKTLQETDGLFPSEEDKKVPLLHGIPKLLRFGDYELVRQGLNQSGEGSGVWGEILHDSKITQEELKKAGVELPFTTKAVLERLENADKGAKKNASVWR